MPFEELVLGETQYNVALANWGVTDDYYFKEKVFDLHDTWFSEHSQKESSIL